MHPLPLSEEEISLIKIKGFKKDHGTQKISLMKKKFSFIMYHYFEFIIPWTTRWKKFFDNDAELFIIWGVVLLNKTMKITTEKILMLFNTETLTVHVYSVLVLIVV